MKPVTSKEILGCCPVVLGIWPCPLHCKRLPFFCDPAGQVHRPIVGHINQSGLFPKPCHLGQDFGARLAPLIVWCPSYALHSRRLCGCHYQFIIQGQSLHNPCIHADDHTKAEAELLESTSFSWSGIGVVLALYLEANGTTPPGMSSMGVCELCLVYAGRVVCCQRVCDQETKCGLYDKDLRVRAE